MAPLTLLCLMAALALGAGVGRAAPAALTVQVTSPRMGLTFTDAEPVDVRAQVTHATAPCVVSFAVCETDGPWQRRGQVNVDQLREGAGEVALPLSLPGRGLYALTAEARCGGESARAESSVGVVFPPAPVTEASPWGIFYIPFTFAGRSPEQSMDDIAANMRLLGASWVRFNFWAQTFGKITVTGEPRPTATGDWSEARKMTQALRKQGLFIMGEVAQCVRELSSQPDGTAVVGDAGPVYNRVKPKDYALWDQLMEKLARDFREDIGVWEIWNEANIPNCYWTGTVEDFAELVHHTSHALKRGNPQAKVAAAGFVGGHDFADKLFSLGMGRDLDILTVHYTDTNPGWMPAWKALLAKHHLSLPVWNSEELSEVPIRNLADGIQHSFKFCHINIGYDAFRLLVNQDLTPRQSAIWFSVGAHCLGAAKWLEHRAAPGCDLDLFQRGGETVAVIGPVGPTAKLFATVRSIVIAAEPLSDRRPVAVTDMWGRTRPLNLRDGKAELVPGKRLFLNGARRVEVLSADIGRPEGVVVAEAEAGRFSPGWSVTTHDGFSEGKTVDIWSDAEPGPEGYWVEVKVTVPRADRYEVIFAGNGLARLKAPRSLSPFSWQMDGGEEHLAADAVPVTEEVAGAPEGVSTLGRLDLAAGEHTFRLRLTGRRDQPDRYYALWFDALALRPAP